jgi:hypothetical protein
MRLVALVLAALVLSAASLPALADCAYHDKVAQSEIKKGDGAQSTIPSDQRRG